MIMPDWTLHEGDCLDVLQSLPEGSVDAVVTDPPYALGFMGKAWDSTLPGIDYWCAVLRALKPGGYLLAFGGTRTYHRLACHIEDAGAEIRDCVMWLYGTGFPKGQGCLKPAYEPIILARRPGKRVLPFQIDDCRASLDGMQTHTQAYQPSASAGFKLLPKKRESGFYNTSGRYPANVAHDGSDEVMEAFALFGERAAGNRPAKRAGIGYMGGASGTFGERQALNSGTAARFFYCAKASQSERWVMLNCECQTATMPAWETKRDRSRSAQTDTTSPNKGICVDVSMAECDLFMSLSGNEPTDQSSQDGKYTTSTKTNKTTDLKTCERSIPQNTSGFIQDANSVAKIGGSHADCVVNSKSSTLTTGTSQRKDTHSTDDAVHAMWPESWKKSGCEKCGAKICETFHATVKPLALMRWLVRLVTPPGGVVLDPFAGSGTTLIAAVAEGRRGIGIERDPGHCVIARNRITAMCPDDLFTETTV